MQPPFNEFAPLLDSQPDRVKVVINGNRTASLRLVLDTDVTAEELMQVDGHSLPPIYRHQ